jgi:CubicO group peptidase (beta-lactamase class C family)
MKIPSAQIDALIADYDHHQSPGGVFGIIKAGELVYKRAYGMADLERGVPLTTESIFDLGSVGKQFVAALALLLEQEGRLSLNDSLRLYLPELPDYSTAIRLRQLIDHTAGFRDYLALMRMTNRSTDYAYPKRELLSLLARQRSLDFDPGQETLYSNSGYFLLGLVFERVMAKPLVELLREYIYQPLGMHNTQGNEDLSRLVPNRALSYYTGPRPGSYITAASALGGFGDGPILSNIDDIFLWDQNFYHNRLGNGGQDFIQTLLTPARLNNGEPIKYAFGLLVDRYRGQPVVHHGGAWAGYRSEILRFPELQFSVIWLSNLGDFNPSQKAFELADLLLEDHMEAKQSIQVQPVALPRASEPLEPDKLLGLFQSEVGDGLISVLQEEGQLVVQTQRTREVLHEIEPNHFMNENQRSPFQIAFSDNDHAEVVQYSRQKSFKRVLDQPTDTLDLNVYVGSYSAEELDIVYRISLGADGLQLECGYGDPEPLTMRGYDLFEAPYRLFAFERNQQNEVNDFYLSMGRIAQMHFTRQRG